MKGYSSTRYEFHTPKIRGSWVFSIFVFSFFQIVAGFDDSAGLVALNDMDLSDGPAFECWPGSHQDAIFMELHKTEGEDHVIGLSA